MFSFLMKVRRYLDLRNRDDEYITAGEDPMFRWAGLYRPKWGKGVTKQVYEERMILLTLMSRYFILDVKKKDLWNSSISFNGTVREGIKIPHYMIMNYSRDLGTIPRSKYENRDYTERYNRTIRMGFTENSTVIIFGYGMIDVRVRLVPIFVES